MSPIVKLISTGIFFLFMKDMVWDFSAEKVNPVLKDQSWREFIVSCKDIWVLSEFFPLQKILKSSTNRVHFTRNLITSVMLLKAIKNSVTERVDPWGTPFSCWNCGDICLFILTENILFVKKLSMKFNIFPLHSMFCNLCDM